jgi:undecaprenyl pyrophosphate synthase
LPKERKYVAGVVAGKTKRKAAKDAGYTASMGDNAKQKIEAKASVQKLFIEVLGKAGVTDELLGTRIREGIDARTTKVFQRRYPRSLTADAAALQELFQDLLQKAEGENKPLADEIRKAVRDYVHGAELITINMIDFSERREMVELVLKATGRYVEKHEHEAGETLGEILARSYELSARHGS